MSDPELDAQLAEVSTLVATYREENACPVNESEFNAVDVYDVLQDAGISGARLVGGHVEDELHYWVEVSVTDHDLIVVDAATKLDSMHGESVTCEGLPPGYAPEVYPETVFHDMFRAAARPSEGGPVLDAETATALRDAVEATQETFDEQMRSVPTLGTEEAWERVQAVHDALEALAALGEVK